MFYAVAGCKCSYYCNSKNTWQQITVLLLNVPDMLIVAKSYLSGEEGRELKPHNPFWLCIHLIWHSGNCHSSWLLSLQDFLSSSQTSLTYYPIMAFKHFRLFASVTCRGQYALMLVMEPVRYILVSRENYKREEILTLTHRRELVFFVTLWITYRSEYTSFNFFVEEFFLHCMTLADGIDMLSRNVSK